MDSKKRSLGNKNWLTWRKVACVALLLLAAGYIYGRPTVERWLGIDLPEIPIGDEGERGNARNDDGSGSDEKLRFDDKSVSDLGSDTKFSLKSIGNGEFESPAGLIYGMGARGETRIDHIMRHTKNMPERPTHGVFDGGRDDVLALIDEAYRLIQKKSNRVNGRKSDQGGNNRMEYKIEMNRRIGYVGGRNGKRQDNPVSTTLKLILEGKRPITAYPTW